ncbi:MAG: rRNA pseudouridine synthase [Clostridia bacterium]|nr:rRNA pseudouridine synthase [Clostridia bacterium]
MRINKYIASTGLCSRRKAEEYILSGNVKVNGKKITELGYDVDEENDTVSINDHKIKPINKKVYVAFNKPKGCICSKKDEKGRKTIYDYLNDYSKYNIVSIGRLDFNTEGLLILTNDGDLANLLTKPSSEVPKKYLAKIEGELTEDDIKKLEAGVIIDGIKLKQCSISIKDYSDNQTSLYITIFEGKNREIHKMFEVFGKTVVFLKRVEFAGIKLGGLSRGGHRYLNEKEISLLKSFYNKNII